MDSPDFLAHEYWLPAGMAAEHVSISVPVARLLIGLRFSSEWRELETLSLTGPGDVTGM